MRKTIISVAMTGSWPTRENNPHLPIEPAEIADGVYACWKAGAAVAHLHMRDSRGNPTMDLERFRETAALIRARCDIILNFTTSGDDGATEAQRMAHLVELRPEMASYDCGTMNWMHRSIFMNPPPFLERLGHTMQEIGVKPEVEIFDMGMLYTAMHYIKTGVLKAPVHFQFVLGAAGGLEANVENLVFLVNHLPEGSTWSALGIGRAHLPILLATLALGGHVRVGMEDNVYYRSGELAVSNAQFVERAARLIREADREPATPAEARALLGLSER